ncbi:MAG: type II secretion system F family protein [Acidobacteria bacterium]|nr:MAG: type II secretion system F family protein [Acidobacteriota bacterium]
MPEYRCRLASPTGEIIERDYVAADVRSLRRELEKQDYLVLGIQRRSAFAAALADLFKRRRKVRMGEFLFFNQEFAALIRAGLPIIESLELLLERRKNPVFKAALEDVRDRVKAGESLSEAFAAQDLFPPLYASTLASGERTGEIATVLERYIRYTQTLMNVRKKVVGALTYPAILVVMSIGLVLILLTYVLPQFEDLFSGFGTDLPLVTRVVVGASAFVRDEWWLLAGALVVGVGTLAVWKRTPVGQRVLERVLYGLPLIGPIAHKFVVTRFSRTLSSLVAGGLPLVTCLEIVGRALGVSIFADAVESVAAKIREGASLHGSLEETGLFPDLVIEMVKIGESSGSLAEMLDHVANFVDEELDHQLQVLISLVEPMLLVFMAVIVAFMLLAIYYPLLMIYAHSSV